MDFGPKLRLSRRSVAIAVALISVVPLALGAHAALNKRSFEAAPSDAAGQPSIAASNRVALVIGNGHYPDATAPLAQPINDARALTGTLRRDGFDVDVVEDATRDELLQAVERLKARVKPDSVVMLFFAGFGIEARGESFMIPVDAAIWREADVRHDGVSVDQVLAQLQQRGGRAKLAVIDASRRNPYERRFRGYSHGLAPIGAPDNALVLSSASPGKVADDASGANSAVVSELLNAIAEKGSAEAAFGKVRNAVARASEGVQVPALSSSLHDVVEFGKAEAATAAATGG
uniref:Peptidase C14, caspase catalytic subunit p20 n=1 Tax=Rhodopseudomonas palustris (strain BisA53) TaxID=316055 RepID=Q07T78_RHOP5